MVNIKKVGIVGCGFVGASTAFALMDKKLFNEMVLIDANKKKAEGEAMDLSHGLPYLHPMNIYAGDYSDLKDAAIIIITAGAAQKPGETRLDLINKNVGIMKSIISEINKVGVEGILLIVANPVDILTHVALKESGLPANRVFGSGTVLDTARFKYLLSQKLDVDARNVHAVVIGEHGDSELCVWSVANISGIPLLDFAELRGITNHEQEMEEIYKNVRDSAYQIIERKGATYYGVAHAVARICSCIVHDEKTMLPISIELDGQYGLNGLSLSLPSLVGINGVEKVLELPLNVREKKQLAASASALKKVIEQIGY
ncbi:MAG: L-lactate dehydrogenase [Bacilli bacterium]|nr:L-lactate dehydrogenase [Bacilli bacterium]